MRDRFNIEKFSASAGPKLRRAATILSSAAVTQELASRIIYWARERSEYVVSVSESDPIWATVHAKVLALLPNRGQRAVKACTTVNRGWEAASRTVEIPTLHLLFDGTRRQRIKLDGHTVNVWVNERSEIQETSSLALINRQIRFTASSAAGRDAIVRFLNEATEECYQAKTAPEFKMLAKWGEWSPCKFVQPRSLETVILDNDQAKRIESDLEKFLSSEDDYSRWSVPWHRGYLFHGPPGTGKTSLARALASRFNLDVYYLPLGDIRQDTDLLRAINEIDPRSMLIVEDVDVYQNQVGDRETNGQTKGASLSGILNALDGLMTPHGLVTVLTTNRIDALDQALWRPGRIDMICELSWCTDTQMQRMWKVFYPDCPFPDGLSITGKISPAQIVECFTRYLDQPESAAIELKTLLSN